MISYHSRRDCFCQVVKMQSNIELARSRSLGQSHVEHPAIGECIIVQLPVLNQFAWRIVAIPGDIMGKDRITGNYCRVGERDDCDGDWMPLRYLVKFPNEHPDKMPHILKPDVPWIALSRLQLVDNSQETITDPVTLSIPLPEEAVFLSEDIQIDKITQLYHKNTISQLRSGSLHLSPITRRSASMSIRGLGVEVPDHIKDLLRSNL